MEGISVILSQLRPEMAALLLFGTALIGYLLGNCNGAVMVSKLLFHDDVRTHGSGNGGLTNFHRTYGGKWVTIVVIAVDMLKVVIAVYLSVFIFRRYMPNGYVPLFVKYWAGIWTVVGHVFPFALKFHGGKGILAGGTLALLVDWRVAVCAWGCFLIGVLLTRWVSFGSLLAATAFGVSSALFHPDPSIAIPALLAGALIDWKHKENFKRIRAGTESRLSFKKKEAPSQPGGEDSPAPSQKKGNPSAENDSAPAKAAPGQTAVPPASSGTDKPVTENASTQPAKEIAPQKPEGITQAILTIPVSAAAMQKEKPQTERAEGEADGQSESGGGTNYLEQIDEWIKADHAPDPGVTEPEPVTESAAREPASPVTETAPAEEKQEVEAP